MAITNPTWPQDGERQLAELAGHYLELASAVDQMECLPQMRECLNDREYAYLEEAIDYMMVVDADLD